MERLSPTLFDVVDLSEFFDVGAFESRESRRGSVEEGVGRGSGLGGHGFGVSDSNPRELVGVQESSYCTAVNGKREQERRMNPSEKREADRSYEREIVT